MAFVRGAIFALLLVFAGGIASAEERIRSFISDVRINADSSLSVTETIHLRAENDAIRHGIYRDFPTRYRGRNGSQIRVGFSFEAAALDGQPVPASASAVGNGVRIKIGDPNTYVPVGEHRYEIRYRTTRQLGRFEDFDELYWNATGNGWQFPIDVAEARIRLPVPAKFGRRAAYTGAQGSTESSAEVVDERSGEIRFRTTAPLAPYEGLTVAVAFPKDVVAAPGGRTRAMWWLADYGPPLVGGLGLLSLMGFYYVAWKRAGRNPRAGTVVPIFEPADGLTPAAMRYLIKMGADNRAFAAALIDMGVRGHVRLVEEEGGWFSGDKTRIERLAATAELPPEEQAALVELARPGESVLMDNKHHAKFSAAKNSLDEALKTQFGERMFRRNWGWALAGLLLFVAVLWFTAAAVVAASDGAAIWQVGVSVGCIVFAAMIAAIIQGTSAVGKCLLSLIGFVAIAVAIGFGMPILGQALASGWYLPMLLPALALPLVISAFFWIAAPTREGRAVLDRIAGFKQYLSITERERLDRMTAPLDTPEIFERYLPFAIALGVENRWADRFAGVLAAAAVQGRQGFGWYSGSDSPWDNPGRFASTVGSSLSGAISSASTAPGSSSGSGGGGSSGGGGGGGGGGGW
ncbi:MAG: DUF2207 domain-containing protein [Pseudomonadota bacterium]|nr:DUF2207 domain-containing protein [Pseudomonadota bacterium]